MSCCVRGPCSYPMVSFIGEEGELLPPEPVTGDQLEVLRWLVLRIAAEPQRIFWRRDSSGGYPIHALLIANNAAAMELSRDVHLQGPLILLQNHGPGPFVEEHVRLH